MREGARAGLAHAFNPSTWEAEAGGLCILDRLGLLELVLGQPGLCKETLSYLPNTQLQLQLHSTVCGLITSKRTTELVFSLTTCSPEPNALFHKDF